MLQQIFKATNRLGRWLKDKFIHKVGRLINNKPMTVWDYKEFCNVLPQRKALVSYLVEPLLLKPKKRNMVSFSNQGIAQYIPRALNELGYRVDIVNYDQVDWNPTTRYDLFIGHGGINFEHISQQLSPDTIQIYFSTGIYWKEFNAREAKRIYDLAIRHGYLLPPDRFILYDEEYANQKCDGIICLGNQEAVQTYKQFPLVIGVNSATYPVNWVGLEDKDFDGGRQHFLFFSGGGNIHKGLDLLLEAFVDTKLHLHICQEIDPDFFRIYRHELAKCPNIHFYGSIVMRSPKFETLAKLCNWVISATCAEGQPGAILECMGYGLIPILPEAANIDLDDFGMLIPDPNNLGIRSIITTCSELSVSECKHRSEIVRKIISDDYSPENFLLCFKKAVQEIMEIKSHK